MSGVDLKERGPAEAGGPSCVCSVRMRAKGLGYFVLRFSVHELLRPTIGYELLRPTIFCGHEVFHPTFFRRRGHEVLRPTIFCGHEVFHPTILRA